MPEAPFSLNPCCRVTDPARFTAYLRARLAEGVRGHQRRAMATTLRQLREVLR